MGQYHPESPARIRAIEDQLIAQRLWDFLLKADVPSASAEQLVRAHQQRYVEEIFEMAPQRGKLQLMLILKN